MYIENIKNIFLPSVVYKDSSLFNKEITVIKLGNSYKLLVNGLLQSISPNTRFAKTRVWGQLAKILKSKAKKPKNLLLLGMGGATMLQLSKEYLENCKTEITCVEIDEKIAKIAKDYFAFDKIKNTKLVIADALEFIGKIGDYKTSSQFDVIIVDTYLGDTYPENIKSLTFFNNIMKISVPNSLVIFNRVFDDANINDLEDFKELTSIIFKSVNVRKVNCRNKSNNYIIYGYLNK